MGVLKGLRTRLRLLRRRRAETDLSDEFRFHLEMETDKNVRAGMSPSAARRRAEAAFGGVDRHQEAMRDERGVRVLEDCIRDVRVALRTFARSPGFAVAAVLTLALAIGANAVVFTMVNGLLFRPFPVPDPDRLVALWETDPGDGGPRQLAWDDYVDWRDRSGIFARAAAQATAPLALSSAKNGDRAAEMVWSEVVTDDFFSVLGLTPVIGRFFLRGEAGPGGSPYIVIGEALWRERFQADPTVVGRAVQVNGQPFEVIGVAPGAFHGIRRFGFWAEAWIPFGAAGTGDYLQGRGGGSLMVFGRLADGVDLDRARTLATAFAANLAATYPATNRDRGALLTSARTPFDSPRYVPPRILTLASMLGLVGVGLILLIACANLANLLLARAASRRREISVRLALGGGRGRIVRQLLAECAVLATAGGLLGLLFAVRARDLQSLALPALQYRVGWDVNVDLRVVLFTGLVAVAAVFLFGLVPALRATKLDLVSALRGEGSRLRRSRIELRDALVVAQIALSVVLLVAGGLFMRSLRASRSIDLGMEAEGRVLMTVTPGLNGYDGSGSLAFYREVRRRVEAMPDVVSAAWGFPAPFDTYGRGVGLYIEGAPAAGDDPVLFFAASTVDPGWFETLGTTVQAGREFSAADTAGADRVLIVNRTMAERYFADGDAIGRTVRMNAVDGPEARIVGVVEDAQYGAPTDAKRPYVFRPAAQSRSEGLTLVVHSRAGGDATIARVRETLRTVDGAVPAYGAITMERAVHNALNVRETAAAVSAILGVLALLLAVIGLYGVVSYTVERRRREVGIRVALGASEWAVQGMVVARAFRTTMLGLAVGLAGALAAGRVLSSLLFEVSPTDARAFAGVAVLLAVVAFVASWLPARRASRVDPMVTLRAE